MAKAQKFIAESISLRTWLGHQGERMLVHTDSGPQVWETWHGCYSARRIPWHRVESFDPESGTHASRIWVTFTKKGTPRCGKLLQEGVRKPGHDYPY